MASASFGESEDDLISNRRHRLGGYDIVYTRRTAKKVNKFGRGDDDAVCTTPVAENPAPVIPPAPEPEASGAVTSADAGACEPSATNVSVVPPPSKTISARGTDGADAGQPLVEEGRTTCHEAANREADTALMLPEEVKNEQIIPNGSCSKQNGVAKDAVVGKLDDKRPSGFGEGNLSEALDDTHRELSQIPDQKDSFNEELMPSLTQGAHDESLVDGHEFGEPLALASFGEMIRLSLGKRSTTEIEDLNQKLENDLESIRRILKEFETKEHQLVSSGGQLSKNKFATNGSFKGPEALNNINYDQGQPHARTDLAQTRLMLRVNPETGPTVNHEGRPIGLSRVNSDIGVQRSLGTRSFNRQLSVAVMETNNRHSEYVVKEKRTPKANQFYRNSEFLLGKDRLPPESNKRLKTGSGRNTEPVHRFGFGFDKGKNELSRSCSSLLQRLMKHKFGWVFNVPVDAKQLGLVGYHDIIKHPMDLGTIKGRLSKNLYKSPMDFAEDVRLVFRNAMTYNPKGQDVHIMAEQLSQIFEERWAVIEMEYNDYCKYQLYKDGRLPTTVPEQPYFRNSSFPASAPMQPSSYGYAPISPHVPGVPQSRTFDRREALPVSVAVDPRTPRSHVGRVPAPKKPKAKDPNKRDMTQDEKQKLSKHLQDLPMEKLDAILQIIKKRNTALSQRDDEIEVDIDSVDPETLWELDRFVSNYKKRLSKNKRKAELALQARTAVSQGAVIPSSAQGIKGIQTENGAFEKSINAAGGEKVEAYNDSSSSSSSSDSGSSSSDSDSDSSSSDGGDSPGT